MNSPGCRRPGPFPSLRAISLSLAYLTVGNGLLTARAADSSPDLQQGETLYLQHCAACHGNQGDGNGPATVWLFPRPRNFNAGLFKIQSTPGGSLPSDEDLYRSITRGLPGSSMPSFTYLPESDRRAVVQYVKHLTAFTGSDGKRINRFQEALKSGPAPKTIVVPPEPPSTLESIVHGKELYTLLACNTCHGQNGAGDGPSAPTLKDALGIPVIPRDFAIGAFRGGSDGSDLYLRINTGIAGTPMPPFPDETVKPADRWDVVHYIQSLRRKDAEVNDILAPENALIKAAHSQEPLPLDPVANAWERVEAVRVPLNPLWPEPNSLPAVAVRALHDGRTLAILLQWRDDIANGAPIRVDEFQDSAALQFSLTGRTPFLGMGDASNPVNVWHWKAGWQAEVNGQREDVSTTYPSLHVDLYPEASNLFITAASAGNIMSLAHATPVEDANARGFGTLTSQGSDRQNVQGRGVWRDGFWNVLIFRDLTSTDPDDAKFIPGTPIPVAFAIWNGEQRDRNGRKVISNWYQLTLEN